MRTTHLFRSTGGSRQRTRAELRPIRLAAALTGTLAVCCLLGGCGNGTSDSGGRRKPHRPPKVIVTVVDGDASSRIAGATVRIGSRSAASNKHGQAILRVRGRVSLTVQASARGYKPSSQRFSFRRSSRRTIRIFRPTLQWPMYGVDPARTQAQTEISLRPPFRVVWSRKLGSLVEFPAVVSDGTAYVANSRGTVAAISMRNGKIAWQRALGTLMAASPAVAGRSLVVHTMGSGRVYVLRRSDGKILWRKEIGSPIESSPVVERGVDYFGSWSGRVYALDLNRKRFRWIYSSGYKVTASAALSGASVYIGDYGGRLLVLSKRGGRLRLSFSVNGKIYGTAAVAHGRVFVPSSTGDSLTAFTTSGRRLWTHYAGGYVYSSPAVWRGRVFFGSYSGVFYCLTAAQGRTLWTVSTGGPISGAVVVVSGVAYAGSFAHRIYGVDALSGRTLVLFPHGEYVPVSGNGQRLLFHGYSQIWALEPRARSSGAAKKPRQRSKPKPGARSSR